MAFVNEKVKVVALEFLNKEKDFESDSIYCQPLYKVKIQSYGWGSEFSIASIFCEVVWKRSVETLPPFETEILDRLFSASPVATYINFKGNKEYWTGNVPKEGAIAFWKRGNGWQGHCGIVTKVEDDNNTFSIVEVRMKSGYDKKPFIEITEKGDKKVNKEFSKSDMNFLGFVYPKHLEF